MDIRPTSDRAIAVKLLLIGLCLGLLLWGLPSFVAEAYYYAKVVRTVDRILRTQNPGIKYSW